MITKLLRMLFGKPTIINKPQNEKTITFDVVEESTGRVLFENKIFTGATCLQNMMKHQILLYQRFRIILLQFHVIALGNIMLLL